MTTFTCRAPATFDVLIDNDKVKVTRWNFTEGAETGWHRHGWDYIVVPLGDGKLIAELPDGTRSESVLTDHVPYFRQEGAEHNIINASGKDYAFIEIELKP